MGLLAGAGILLQWSLFPHFAEIQVPPKEGYLELFSYMGK
jgi:hypothetical protein